MVVVVVLTVVAVGALVVGIVVEVMPHTLENFVTHQYLKRFRCQVTAGTFVCPYVICTARARAKLPTLKLRK